MVSKEVRDKLEKITNVTSISSVASKILATLEDPNISVAEAAKVLSSDLSITSRILTIVNSVFYGFPKEISTIDRAIVILGFKSVKNIVITTLFLAEVAEKQNKLKRSDREVFWKHSVACAAIAKVISSFLKICSPEELFVCGLVHDIGKIVIADYFTQDYEEILLYSKKMSCAANIAEKHILGCNHSDVGNFLAKKWQFPDLICETIQLHHKPSQSKRFREETCIINIADSLALREGYGISFKEREETVSVFSLEPLAVPGTKLNEFINSSEFNKRVNEELDKSKIFFSFT